MRLSIQRPPAVVLSTADRPGNWLRHYRRGPEAAALVCFPCAGGTAAAYRGWATPLSQRVEVIGVQYPGRQDRLAETCARSVEELADGAAEAVLGHVVDAKPLALFGHSLGASVAHEVAVRLQAAGRPAQLLMVSGRRPPHLLQTTRDRPWTDDELIADVARLGGSGAAVLAEPDLRDLVLPAIRADYAAVERYRPGPLGILDSPVVGYAGADDPEVGRSELAGWARVTSGEFRTVVFPGDHFYLEQDPAPLLADVDRELTEITGR